MEFANRTPIDEVAALRMPFPDEVMLNHGIAEVIWGIRKEHDDGDIDAATCLENNLYLESEHGFTAKQREVGKGKDKNPITIVSRHDEHDRFDFHRWDFSVHRWNRTERGRIYISQLGAMSVQDPVTRIHVLLPEYLPLEKLETGRPKDEEAVERVRAFLRKHGRREPEETIHTT